MAGAVSFALLLAVAALQLQSPDAASIRAEQPAAVQAVTASSLIQKVEKFVKVSNTLGSLAGQTLSASGLGLARETTH